MKRKNYKGIIKNIEKLNSEVYELKIKSSLKEAYPGQFISLLCPNHTFRRPFSIADFGSNIITLLIKLRGDGTKYLTSLKEGNEVDFIAPLGNSFELANKKCLLVGAGIGIAPMLFLKKELNKKNIENYLISGFKNEKEIIKGSDDITIGGSVLDNIENIIKDKKIEVIYSCGPIPVLKGISEISKKFNIVSYITMEKIMACSIGVCRGCTIKILKDGVIKKASVCKDGTIFKGDEVIWE